MPENEIVQYMQQRGYITQNPTTGQLVEVTPGTIVPYQPQRISQPVPNQEANRFWLKVSIVAVGSSVCFALVFISFAVFLNALKPEPQQPIIIREPAPVPFQPPVQQGDQCKLLCF